MEKLIKFVKTYQSDIVLAIAIVLISVTAFNMGKISVSGDKKSPITITEPVTSGQFTVDSEKQKDSNLKPNTQNPKPSFVVASKASKSKLYHFPWCSGASRIAEKNKLTFPTEIAALAAGYTLAGNCAR